MSTITTTVGKVGGFVAGLVAVFALALGVGAWLGPDPAQTPAAAHDADHDTGHDAEEDAGHGDMDGMSDMDEASVPAGLMVSQGGYTLNLDDTRAEAGDAVPMEFTIRAPSGEPLTDYDLEHEREMHLIAVRRDATGFQHVHPELGATGSWSTALDLSAGDWRVFADFRPAGGERLTLGSDLAVAGDYAPVPVGTQTRVAEVDGFSVRLDGDLVAGGEAPLTLTVERDGVPVTDLQPYLGAYGHLVALRGGDLAYLHVHPEGTPDDGVTRPGPEVTFVAEAPSAGTYHLYLDFRHDDVVRTAAFRIDAASEEER